MSLDEVEVFRVANLTITARWRKGPVCGGMGNSTRSQDDNSIFRMISRSSSITQ